MLINYNNQHKVIDFKEIAYDEIAESCQRKTSKISKNYFQLTKMDFCDGSITKENFIIESNGKIKVN